MGFNIEELRKTLELNRSDIINSHLLTNEYMIDDIMQQLGYNKRRDAGVKRLLDRDIDWEVLSDGSPKVAVKVFALGDTINPETVNKAMDYCKEKRFSIFIVTDGESMTICRYNKVKREYTEVCDISLLEDLSDTNKQLIEAISKDTFNMEVVDSLIAQREVTPKRVIDVLLNNIGSVASQVAIWIGNPTDSLTEQCVEALKSVFSNDIKETDSDSITELERKVIELEESVADRDKKIQELEVSLTSKEEKLVASEELIASYEKSDTESKITAYEARIAELEALSLEENSSEESVAGKDELIVELTNKVEELESKLANKAETAGDSENVSSDIQSEIDAYREKIQELTNKYAESADEIKRLEEIIRDNEAKLNNMTGADKQKALDLLGVIVDSKNLPRSYVAVINTELLQYEELHTFVGRTLQKLYELKSYEASQFIFNGDIFKLVQPSVRNDLIMNNKQYDVEIDNIHEDEVLNKLRIMFSHFSDIIFECKKIGTLGITDELENTEIDTLEIPENVSIIETDTFNSEASELVDDTDELEEEIFEKIENNPDDLEEADVDDAFETDGLLGETFSNVDITGNSEQNTVDLEEAIPNNYSINLNKVDESQVPGLMLGAVNNDMDILSEIEATLDEDLDSSMVFNDETDLQNTNQMIRGLLCGQLLQIDALIWNDECNIRFNTIKYIGSSNINFNVNMNCDEISNEQLFCKGLDAILALAVSSGNTGVLSNLRQSDLSQVSSFFKLYTEEYANSTRINGTRFVITDVETVQQVTSVLADICDMIGIDKSDIFLFFDAETDSQQLVDDWGYEEAAVQLREYTEYNGGNTADTIAILKGNIFTNIIVTKNSLQTHKMVFGEALAVKTNYLAKRITNEVDFVESVRIIVEEAIKLGQQINFNSIGNVIGESYKLVSTDSSEVSDRAVQLNAGGMLIYVSPVEDWQIPLSLIKAHTALMSNTSIAVKININKEALDFLLNEYTVAEPSLSLAVSSFAKYVQSCVK